MHSILIKNGTVITMNPGREVLRADIYIEDDRIVRMGPDLADAASIRTTRWTRRTE